MEVIYRITDTHGNVLYKAESYEDAIGWIWRRTDEYKLSGVETNYSNDKPSKMVIAYKVIRE